jgi:hypothetical protein
LIKWALMAVLVRSERNQAATLAAKRRAFVLSQNFHFGEMPADTGLRTQQRKTAD